MAKRKVRIPSRPGGRKKGNQKQKEIIKQFTQMQEQMVEAQNQLDEKEFTGSSGGGVVKTTMKGDYSVIGLKIDPGIIDEDDVEMLEDLIVASISDAYHQVKEAAESATASLGDNIPPGLNLDDLPISGL